MSHSGTAALNKHFWFSYMVTWQPLCAPIWLGGMVPVYKSANCFTRTQVPSKHEFSITAYWIRQILRKKKNFLENDRQVNAICLLAFRCFPHHLDFFFFLSVKITEERKSPAITKQIVQKIGTHKFGLLDSVLFHY